MEKGMAYTPPTVAFPKKSGRRCPCVRHSRSSKALRRFLPRRPEKEKPRPRVCPVLTYSDRLALALAISSSVLQLHETPWLGGRALMCDDILFLDASMCKLSWQLA